MLISFGTTYFLICHKHFTRDAFAKALCAKPGSWAELFANRLFYCLVGNTSDVMEEYDLFYKEEYPDFETFLKKAYGCKDQTLGIIRDQCQTDSTILYGSYESEGDYNISQLLEFSEDIVGSINEAFSNMEAQ